MAKRKGSKSEAIREYIAAHPSAKPKEILAALRARGIDVSAGLISVVKYSKKSNLASKPSRPKRATPESNEVSLDQLRDVKMLADSLGGIEKAREVLNVLESLS